MINIIIMNIFLLKTAYLIKLKNIAKKYALNKNKISF